MLIQTDFSYTNSVMSTPSSADLTSVLSTIYTSSYVTSSTASMTDSIIPISSAKSDPDFLRFDDVSCLK